MKVLLVHNEYREPGGEDVVFRQEAELLSRFGHTVLVYRRGNSEIRVQSNLERASLVKRLIWAEDSRKEISAILRRERPAIVHVHNTFMQISPCVFAASNEADVPVVQTLHNFRLLCPAATFFRQGHVCEECAEHGLWRGVAHGCYHDSHAQTASVALMLTTHRVLGTWEDKIDRYIAPSEFTRWKFVEASFPAEKISVKPNFVYPDPGPGERSGDYALFVGRLSGEKGVATLLRAWAQLGCTVPLVIAGDGPLRAEMEEECERNGLGSVRFLGRVPRQTALELVKGARFVIVPSQCYENFPMTIVESFATGTPVICSQLGAMQTIVENRRTGLFFEPGNSDDLAQKVAWAWAHPGPMRVIGAEARREYEHRYTAEKNYEILSDIYQRTISERLQ
jgi:glycosyltransferase involved in cell wall biosynthesis